MAGINYLLVTIISVLLSTSFSSKIIDCGEPHFYQVEIDNNEFVHIYQPRLEVKFQRSNLAIYEYPDTNAVNILINNTEVFFSAFVLRKHEQLESAQRTSTVLGTKIAGSARLKRNVYRDDELSECHLYLSKDRTVRYSVMENRLQTEILHQAALCLRVSLCRILGAITLDDKRNAIMHPYSFGSLAAVPQNINELSENSITYADSTCNREKINDKSDLSSVVTSIDQIERNSDKKRGLQSTINVLVDIAIAEIVRKMREENQGTIHLPYINEKFAGGSIWKPTGRFEASNGYFSNLTTLSRTEDAKLSHQGLKFIATCGFGLSTANVHYDKYKLKYGLIKVSGEFSANIDGASLATTFAVDYNQTPCRVILQELRVTNLGKIRVKFTGLGPLNKLMSKLVTWITKKWKEEIVEKVEARIRQVIEAHLDKFNCEKYRP